MARARLLLVVLVFSAGCSMTAHIDLSIDSHLGQECAATAPGNPPPPMSCDQMTIDCADHILFRVRQVQNGQAGDIINSRCLSTAALGKPRTLCELLSMRDPVSLIDSVPNGTRFIFQLAVLRFTDARGGCDNDTSPPVRIFSGVTDPILVDGNSHLATLHLTSCGSCSDLPSGMSSDGGAASDLGFSTVDLAAPSDAALSSDAGGPDGFTVADLSSAPDLTPPPDLLQSICPPGQVESPWYAQGGARCCPPLPLSQCPAPGTRCPDGTPALLPPGGCCALCD